MAESAQDSEIAFPVAVRGFFRLSPIGESDDVVNLSSRADSSAANFAAVICACEDALTNPLRDFRVVIGADPFLYGAGHLSLPCLALPRPAPPGHAMPSPSAITTDP